MNLNKVNIYFFVKKSRTQGKRGHLYVRVTVNGRKMTSSVKSLAMYPHEFDVETQNPNKKCDLYFECHNFMVGIRQEINRIHNEYEKKKFLFTKDHLEKAVEQVYYRVKNGRDADEKTFLDIYDEFIAEEAKGLGKLISKGTHSVRMRYRKILEKCLLTMKIYDAPVCNFSEKDVAGIKSELMRSYALGTAARIFPVFSMVFEFAVKKNIIHENVFKKSESIKYSTTTDLVWLENEEVHKLMSLELTGQAYRQRSAFLFCCFTGLSIGDYMLLNSKTQDEIIKKAESPKDIQPGEIITMKAGDFLIGKRRKTGTMFRVPLLPEAAAIIEEYGGLDKLPFNLVKVSHVLNALMNMAGIRKTVRFHTARKTMANYLLNVKMMNPYYVKEVMGWRKIEEATPYTVVNNDTLAHQMFNKN